MNGWSWYWLGWLTVSVVAFAVPEGYALASGQYQNTLSENVWRLEELAPSQHLTQWHAAHILIGGVLILVLGWLIGHLVFGIWR